MQKLTDSQLIIAQSQGALERIYTLFDTSPEVFSLPDCVKAQSIKGRIEICNLEFEYMFNSPVLKDLNLTIEPFQSVAFVGPSGSGKTTLTSLIPRFYDLKSGEIRIDDRNIRQYCLRSLRKSIAIVPQEPLLFSGSIFDNISYGRPEANESEVYAAAKLAFADEYIEQLSHKYDTVVGEKGAKLSGGQKQRIAIARAFLKNAPILILDEATSALDNESERLIQKALQNLKQNRTTIIIAHRLSTIRHVDNIFVFNEGHIVEQGTHDQLMKYNGLYAYLLAQAERRNPIEMI